MKLRLPLWPIDLSVRGRARVWLLTIVGTMFCIGFAFLFDGYSFEAREWKGWGANPVNNLIIPLLLAPPFFFFLLGKLRQLAIAHHDLMVVASTDGLTSCLNRMAFTALVDGYLEHAQRPDADRKGALLVIDVDHFKAVNDRFGHASGDEALRVVARTIRQNVRDIDLVGRLGGEEFGVFLPGLDPARTGAVAERIRASVNASAFFPEGNPAQLSVSVGGATFDQGSSFSELFQHADQYLYVAKQNGRNRIEVHPLPRNAEPRLLLH